MTNSLTVVAKIFSNSLIFLLQKFEKLLQWIYAKATHICFSAKNYECFAIFQDKNSKVTLPNNFVKTVLNN